MADDVGRRLFAAGSRAETARITSILRKETVGGALLIAMSFVALVWANSPLADSYLAFRDFEVGPAGLHLHLSLGAWAADGLLAIFFFVVGLELKREFVAGDLRDPRRAAVPIFAAVGGMAAPALIYLVINLNLPKGAPQGWAIPTATDIAFALAVLAVVSTHLPAALRTFLLTLAVVDDLFAITIIALFYTDDLNAIALLASLVPLALFALCVQKRLHPWWLLLPLAVATWGLVHASGVHATVAGVLLGFAVPVKPNHAGDPDSGSGLAEHFEHLVRPLSAGVAVPVFAFFASGVAIGGISGLSESLTTPVALGIMAGLLLGKSAGVFGAAYLTARLTRATLDPDLRWLDVFGIALLAGIGFTVALLIGELAFGYGGAEGGHVKVAVLAGSMTASVLAATILKSRDRAYRRIEEAAQAERG